MVPFVHLDVFTDRALTGNQLTVFPDAVDLNATTMQLIAREMNLSESAFVFPPQGVGTIARIRIFSLDRELPFAAIRSTAVSARGGDHNRRALHRERAGGRARCRPPATYLPEVRDVFFVAGQPRSRRIFTRDPAGVVVGFVDRREGGDVRWQKVAAPPSQ
jgi:Phenazine biosynthesis-like protein